MQGAGKIPFICIDLAGGANMVGSNVLVGGTGRAARFPVGGGLRPPRPAGRHGAERAEPGERDQRLHRDRSLGLAFHSDSAFVRGILERVSVTTAAAINGAVIPARSENDTGNNPHNPMYGIYRAGADGELLTLIGSQSSESGGNSMAPAAMIDPSVRPTKVDRTSDVTGLVDTGKLVGLLDQDDAVRVMESIQRLSRPQARARRHRHHARRGHQGPGALQLRQGSRPDRPLRRSVGAQPGARSGHRRPSGHLHAEPEFDNDSEFRKTAAVMKLVVNGYAGAGTITMGGYDYHGQGRATGELRDLRAGRCMGACLEYRRAPRRAADALRVQRRFAVGRRHGRQFSVDGRGKFDWTSDNQQTAASFFLVYNPQGRPQLYTGDSRPPEQHQQIGWFRRDASVETAGQRRRPTTSTCWSRP